ncbi:MAG TPA: hypothetical protein PK583_00210 [Gammaproteobacteria bacterium]|nr:hypothetical protein [Gammaproteobacteria bacterium]HRA42860.1 hypothetical protein [Gammaproteobacteria bacterium]
MNPYTEHVNRVISKLIDESLKREYFYNRDHKSRLEDISSQLKNIENGFKSVFNNDPDWAFWDRAKCNEANHIDGTIEHLKQSRNICYLHKFRPNEQAFNIKFLCQTKQEGFVLTISFTRGRENNSEKDFPFQELQYSLESLGNHLKWVLIEAEQSW